MLVGPVPSVLEELLAADVGLLDALLRQLVHHLGFGGDGGVVGARHPAGVLALHAGAADQDVLNRVVHHVAHVKHTGHIGRWDHDGIGFAFVRGGVEVVLVHPVFVPFAFNFLRAVFAADFHSRKNEAQK